MRVFDFRDYRSFVAQRIKGLPSGGRGELLRISKKIHLHTTSLSQVLKGDRQLSLEHAAALCDHFDLNEKETRYFLLLVQWDRAGTPALKAILDRQLKELSESAREVVTVVPRDRILTLEEQATFYSSWFYSAARMLTSIPGHETVSSIAKRLDLPSSLISEVTRFLVSKGLCVEKNGRLQFGPKSTHLESNSPLISRHHSNWRVKAMEKHPSLTRSELAYTSPMSLSENDVEVIRKLLLEAIEKIHKIREPSECEKLYCLGIDWFEI